MGNAKPAIADAFAAAQPVPALARDYQGKRTRPSTCTSGSSATPKRSSTRRAALPHQRHHVRGARAAGVLDEVRVLGREARASHLQAVAARRGEQLPGAAPIGGPADRGS